MDDRIEPDNRVHGLLVLVPCADGLLVIVCRSDPDVVPLRPPRAVSRSFSLLASASISSTALHFSYSPLRPSIARHQQDPDTKSTPPSAARAIHLLLVREPDAGRFHRRPTVLTCRPEALEAMRQNPRVVEIIDSHEQEVRVSMIKGTDETQVIRHSLPTVLAILAFLAASPANVLVELLPMAETRLDL